MYLNIEILGILFFLIIAGGIYLYEIHKDDTKKQEAGLKACFIACIVAPILAVILSKL